MLILAIDSEECLAERMFDAYRAGQWKAKGGPQPFEEDDDEGWAGLPEAERDRLPHSR